MTRGSEAAHDWGRGNRNILRQGSFGADTRLTGSGAERWNSCHSEQKIWTAATDPMSAVQGKTATSSELPFTRYGYGRAIQFSCRPLGGRCEFVDVAIRDCGLPPAQAL